MTRNPLAFDPGTVVEVLGVWDTRRTTTDGRAWHAHWRQAQAWAAAHMAPYHTETYRAEFCRLDGIPAAILYRYDLCEHGRRYAGPPAWKPAVRPPCVLALDELPPRELLEA